MNRAAAISIGVAPFVLAIGLYATGTLEWMDNAIERHRWGPKAPHAGPTRPLENYAGWWQREGIPNYGTEWVSRIIVRTEGKRAWLRMWHYCETKYCEQGEFEADVYGKPPDDVYALEVVRKKGKDVFWTITLRPNGDNPKSLVILDDRRARDPGKNPMDNQSSFTALRRVK
ncbi:MAG TPA: hypothetical protein VFO57_08360 [Burkholderiales bacterium]|nr:hypothetical protein [Burkholderiales bacterium]